MGIAISSTPMYLGEISPPNIRGNLGSMIAAASYIGILIEWFDDDKETVDLMNNGKHLFSNLRDWARYYGHGYQDLMEW